MNPIQWFDDFSTSIQNTVCLQKGKPTSLAEGYAALSAILVSTRAAGKAAYWIGNGGSNAICSHLSQDLLNKISLRSFALNDASLLTCMSNDFGYESSFSAPLSKMITSDDLLIAISSSGNSQNIISAVETVKEKGARVVTLSSFQKDNSLFNIQDADIGFYLPASLYGHAELGHAAIMHAAIECLYLDESEKS